MTISKAHQRPGHITHAAIKYTMWLQNQTPAHVLDGNTHYEMRNKKKPHLASIQEFSVAAYMKDLKAGKLDSQAQVGCYVGYKA